MSEVLEVNELEIRALVSEEKDTYGQDGFFSLIANILASDEGQIVFLNSAHAAKTRIVVRCCRLEIQGKITSCSKAHEFLKAVVAIEDVRMLKRMQ